MSIVEETRRKGYESVVPKRADRCDVILSVLGDKQMTVSELVKALLDDGIIRYYDRNFVAPRLTELKEAGKVRVIGKRACIMSGKMIAVWERVDK